MTNEEKRLLIELARIAMSEASPDAQSRIERLIGDVEAADMEREHQKEPAA